jgi:AcrR family transcriptional regulator
MCPTKDYTNLSVSVLISSAMSVGDRPGDDDSGPVANRTSAARERVLETAYELFSQHGIRAVGVDRIVAASGVAKMTLYRHFPSKEALVLAFLDLRERRWTYGWLDAGIERRADEGDDRLLAVFDLLDNWFRTPEFEGCPFLSTLLEVHDGSPAVRAACARHLDAVQQVLARHAAAYGCLTPTETARQLHLLTIGAIVAAARGDLDAAGDARAVAEGVVRKARG